MSYEVVCPTILSWQKFLIKEISRDSKMAARERKQKVCLLK
jgi:hypothetical protein